LGPPFSRRVAGFDGAPSPNSSCSPPSMLTIGVSAWPFAEPAIPISTHVASAATALVVRRACRPSNLEPPSEFIMILPRTKHRVTQIAGGIYARVHQARHDSDPDSHTTTPYARRLPTRPIAYLPTLTSLLSARRQR
jgi:hypothetical protein